MVVVLGKDVDARDEEQSGTEVDGQGNGDVADQVCPAADPTSNPTPFSGRKHKGLVVDTSGGRVDTGDFTQRRGDADNNGRDSNPAPDDVDGTAAGYGVDKGGCETVGN